MKEVRLKGTVKAQTKKGKRQSTAALQNAGARIRAARNSARFWSAAVLCRFKRLASAASLIAFLLGILTLPGLAADTELTAQEKKSGWLLLFDGKSLNGWMTSDQKASRRPVEDGCLNPHKSGHYMLVHTQQWSDFVVALDFKITNGCNSGIFVRTASLTPLPGKDVGYNGIEVQILDSTNADFYDTGAIYDLSRPTKNAMKPAGEWNHIEVTCAAHLIDVVLNGEKVNHLDLDQFAERNKRPDGTPHKFDTAYKDHPRTGYIGLQDHGADCWFKNIKLRPLKKTDRPQ